LAALGDGIADSVGGQQRKMQGLGDGDRGAVAGLFFPLEMALQFDVDVAGSEDAEELIDTLSSFVVAALLQGRGEGAFRAPSEADQSVGMFLQLLLGDCPFAFFGAQLHFGDQAAEIPIASAGGDKKGKAEGMADFRLQIAD